MRGLDEYITGSRYSRQTVECACPKCQETYYVHWHTEYGHSYTEDDTVCPKCRVALTEVGEADMGSKWDLDPRV